MLKTWKEAHGTWNFPKIPHSRQYRLYVPETGEHPARARPYFMERIIRKYSKEGEFILDPMCGAGTTLVEGLKLKRHSYGIEPDPKYLKIARANIENILTQHRLDKFWGKPHTPLFGFVYEGYAEEHLPIMANELNLFYHLITFSPPYEGISYTYRSASGQYKHEPDECRGFDTSVIPASQRQVKRYYSDDPKNIANFKKDKYWEAMIKIYSFCYDIGDRMVVIVKNQIENHKERDFAQETINHITQNTQWKFKWAHLAMLGEPSHWENVRRKRFPEADKVDWEHVLVFEGKD